MSTEKTEPTPALRSWLSDRQGPVLVRRVAAAVGWDASTKQGLSKLAHAMRRLGWRKGGQVAGSKGSSEWFPPLGEPGTRPS